MMHSDEENPDFICPITHAKMENPVLSIYGHNFEYSAISQWIARNACCPLTQRLLTLNDLTIDHVLRKRMGLPKLHSPHRNTISWKRIPNYPPFKVEQPHLQLRYELHLSAKPLQTAEATQPISRVQRFFNCFWLFSSCQPNPVRNPELIDAQLTISQTKHYDLYKFIDAVHNNASVEQKIEATYHFELTPRRTQFQNYNAQTHYRLLTNHWIAQKQALEELKSKVSNMDITYQLLIEQNFDKELEALPNNPHLFKQW